MKAGFLQAICEEPDEDAHRLVYADWLDDNGDPDRAEFIRVQCALAKVEADDPEAEPLRLREKELLSQHEPTWRLELPTLPDVTWGREFRRGFVDKATVGNYIHWKDRGEAILQAIPLDVLEIVRIQPATVRRLARYPSTKRVRGVEFRTGHFGDTDLEVLARECQFREFTYASAGEGRTTLGPDARHIFATMPCFAGLRRLWLHHIPFGNAGAVRLAGAPNLAGITSLRLSRCQVTSLGTGAIASQAGWPSLRSLHLNGNYIDDDGCRAVASSPGLGELRELNLAHNNLTSSGATALARSMFLCRLRTLSLAGCMLGEDAAEALATSTNLAGLQGLSLEFTGITPAGVVTLFRSPLAQNLRWLNLRGVLLDSDTVGDLVDVAGLEALQTLVLSLETQDDRLHQRFGDRVQFI